MDDVLNLRRFPFGQPLRPVVQADRTPKKVFVLGVYASAVHARWVGPDGREVVRALAVASEPYIFWRGDGVDDIVRGIDVPPAVGKLVPAHAALNGPSGVTLGESILRPLGYSLADAWLCDLVPWSCTNPAQERAIERAYLPLVERHGLPRPSIPSVPKVLADDARRQAILDELRESRASLLVLLGDQPIRHFLHAFDPRWRRLADFSEYGRPSEANVGGMKLEVVALAHPRQVARLGRSSEQWYKRHADWIGGGGVAATTPRLSPAGVQKYELVRRLDCR